MLRFQRHVECNRFKVEVQLPLETLSKGGGEGGEILTSRELGDGLGDADEEAGGHEVLAAADVRPDDDVRMEQLQAPLHFQRYRHTLAG